MTDARRLHADALVIDGLVYHCDGDATDLRAGGVDALNVTVCHFEADFPDACAQIARWHGILSAPNAPWRLIERAADLDSAKAEGKIGLIMGWQNTRPVADQPERLDFFHRLGLRIMQLTYNYRNFYGDGCLEPEGAGLTSLGHELIGHMNRLGIAIDLSHVGEATSRDVIEASADPVLITHANAHALLPIERNKTDAMIRAVVAKGGLIGASIYGPMCWSGDVTRRPTIDDYVRHLEHLVNVAGIAHVSFGTDLGTGADLKKIAFERLTPRRWPVIDRFNSAFGNEIPDRYLDGCASHRDLPKITEALSKRGWSDDHIRGYLGGNLRRVLAQIWRG